MSSVSIVPEIVSRHLDERLFMDGWRWIRKGWAALAILTFTTWPLMAADPLSPEESLTAFQIDNDLVMEIVAAEPDVIDPVFAAFDPAGRLWVVEMRDYPNGPAAGEPGRSRIRILTDADGDGRFTDPITFADQLLFANSLMFWQDGVLVTTDGRIDFLADRDADGEAEFRETWFSGFARENPQLRCNDPTLGLDGWIYVANGLRGGTIVGQRPGWPKHEPVTLGSRDFRFRPETGEAETVSGFGQYGMSFDDFGNRFLCSNRNPCMHTVLPEAALRRNPLVAVPAVTVDVAAAGEASRIYPISRFWTTSNLHEGQFTAACSVHIFRGDGLPQAFYGNAFTCDPTGNLVHREVLSPQGATFVGRSPYEKREFLATKDTWFRPVNLTVDPNGSLIVVDMYRAVIEHPEYMPDELKTRPDLTLGDDRGRIYRIRNRPSKQREPKAIDVSDDAQLVRLLDHPNAWQRDTAFRLLIEHPRPQAAQPLRDLLAKAQTDVGKVNAIWALAASDSLTEDDLLTALQSGRPRVIEQAVKLAAARFSESSRLIDRVYAIAGEQNDTRLRFEIAMGLAAFPTDNRRIETLVRILETGLDDPWLAAAVALSAGQQIDVVTTVFLQQAREKNQELEATSDALGRLLETIGAGGDAGQIKSVLREIEALRSPKGPAGLVWMSRLWQRLAQGLRARGLRPADTILKVANDIPLPLESLFADAAAMAGDTTRDVPTRIDSLKLLEFADFPFAEPALSQGLNETELAITQTAVSTLARHSAPEAATILLKDFESRSPAVRREILAAMLSSDARISLLLDEIDAGRIAVTELDSTRLQQLAQVRNPDLQARVAKIMAAHKPASRTDVIARYEPALTMTGDPRRGREIFARNCTQCHRIGDLGVNVAPDISDSRVKQPSQLLVDILDPNRAIDNNFFNYAVLDRDGLVQTGIIATETATSVTLRQPDDKRQTISREHIESIKSTGLSLMPVGLEQNIPVPAMADLIAFIKNWRYLDGSVPEEVIR